MATYCYFCEKKLRTFGDTDGYWDFGDAACCDACHKKIATLCKEIFDENSTKATFDKIADLYPGKVTEEAHNLIVQLFVPSLEEQRKLQLQKEQRKREQEEEELRQEAERARQEAERIRREAERARQEAERIRREKEREATLQARLDALKAKGHDGYYEYKIVHLRDGSDGSGNYFGIENTINNLGLDGWRLRCAYANEIGKTSNSSTSFGYTSGTNATIDDNVLIFERFVRFDTK